METNPFRASMLQRSQSPSDDPFAELPTPPAPLANHRSGSTTPTGLPPTNPFFLGVEQQPAAFAHYGGTPNTQPANPRTVAPTPAASYNSTNYPTKLGFPPAVTAQSPSLGGNSPAHSPAASPMLQLEPPSYIESESRRHSAPSLTSTDDEKSQLALRDERYREGYEEGMRIARELERQRRRELREQRRQPGREHSSREHSSREHSSREHSSREHSSREHSSREHSSREHSSREHSSREHSTREHAPSREHSTREHLTREHSTREHSTREHSTREHPREFSSRERREHSREHRDPKDPSRQRRSRSKSESGTRRTPKIKNASLDIIDKMDVTSFYGGSGFHHDGPFDACAPHRNKTTRNGTAPLAAFPADGPNNSLAIEDPSSAAFRKEQEVHGYSHRAAQPVASFDPTDRGQKVYGERSLGLGSSTFIDGTPASREAQLEAGRERSASLGRSKSLLRRQPSARRAPQDDAESEAPKSLLGRVKSLRVGRH